jgi:hypothetical protein
MLAFDHGALFRAVIQNALHSISIESDDSVNGAERVPIAFAARYAVSLYHIAYPCSPFTVVRVPRFSSLNPKAHFVNGATR